MMAQRSPDGKGSGTAGSGGSGSARRIEVDPERVVKWVSGFAERHGELHGMDGVSAWSSAQRSVALTAADGAVAVLEPLVPADGSAPVAGSAPVGPGDLDGLAAWATPPAAIALILVRRGGYAVGLGHGPELTSHKVGTRYVQSRTAAGGWSQHRFARRRDNQADALVVSVIEHARRVVLASPTGALIVGGDKSLVRDVLSDPRLARLAQLPRRELFDLPDPKLIVLKQALRRGRAVRILLSEPEAKASPDRRPSPPDPGHQPPGIRPGPA
jgi:Actinobacteria/chloroflexi VLRF1 release factor